MKRSNLWLFIFILLQWMWVSDGVFAGESDSLAVVQFHSGESSLNPEKVTYKVRSQLITTGNYEVISPAKVEEALNKLRINSRGFLNKEDGVSLAKLLNCRYVLMGEVVSLDIDRFVTYPGGINIGKVRWQGVHTVTVNLQISARLLDGDTGEVIFTERFKGYSHRESHDVGVEYVNISMGDPDSDSMVRIAFHQALDCLVKKVIASTPMWGWVLAVEEEYMVIDLGSDRGIKPGMKFAVMEKKQYTHPQTGEIISSTEEKAVITVEKVMEKLSHCVLKEGDKEAIKPGFTVIFRE